MKQKRFLKAAVYHALVFLIGIIMIYPLIWMVMSSFKETNTIFTTAGSLIPKKFVLDNYVTGWKGFAKVSFATFFKNSFFIAVVATIGTVASSAIVAYGFARFKFRGRGLLFAAMLLSMMLPAQVLMIPQYLWYQKLGWVGTYLPLTVPYFFATQGFFVYLISNFISGIPVELDEAAKIDGCSYFGIFAEETDRSKRYNMVSRHFHEGLELYFLLEGQRCYFIDQDTYHAEEGMAVLVNRNQIHKTSTSGGCHRHRRFLLQIDARKFEEYLKLFGFADGSALGDRYWGVCAYQLVTLRVMELLMLFVQNRIHTGETAWKEDPHAIHTGMYQKVHEIALFLQNNCADSIPLEELAARFYISKPYLTRIFKSVTGFTVVEYRTFCRIRKAKTLLAETDLSITEIAAQTGFGNITYFERVFQKATDSSPLRYRKEYRK